MLDEATIDLIYKKIGSNVAKNRKEKGFSQLKLSLEMGYSSVSVVSFSEIYLNKTHFNIEHLLQISSILDISLDEILNGVQDIIDLNKIK